MTKKTQKSQKTTAEPDYGKLLRLADMIADHPPYAVPNLITDLEATEKLRAFEKPKGSGRWCVALAGLTSAPARDQATALTNWANAARRAVLRAA